MIYRAPGRDRAGLGRFRRTGFGRRKSPGSAYQAEIQRAEKYIGRHMVAWMYERFCEGVSVWKTHIDEENSFLALHNRILKLISAGIGEHVSGPNGIYLRYCLRCRERLLSGIWAQTAGPAAKEKKGRARGRYIRFRRRCSGLFLVERFDDKELVMFAEYVIRLALEDLTRFYGKRMSEPFSEEEAGRILERLDGVRFYRTAKENFLYFVSLYVDRTWNDYLESEEFQAELREAAQIATEEFLGRE